MLRPLRWSWIAAGLVSVVSLGSFLIPADVAASRSETAPEKVAAENVVASTPPMGWNSWYSYGKAINEDLIKAQADAMVSTGMKDAGYQYVIVDGGWRAPTRDAQGNMQVDREKFPSGMAALVDYVHSKGLKFGLHQPVGMTDCGGETPGTQSAPGGERQDAELFARWGVDFLKYDLCRYQYPDDATFEERKEITIKAYQRMRDALMATGRPIVYSISEYGRYDPWTWAPEIANMWRTTKDIKHCWDCLDPPRPGVTAVIDQNADLHPYSGPGKWNDPDQMHVGVKIRLKRQQPVPTEPLPDVEERSHFSMWAMLAAPMIISPDLRTVDAADHEILTNKEVIAVDQDPLGKQARRIRDDGDREVWSRPLADGSAAVALFNRGEGGATLDVTARQLGLPRAAGYSVRDLWAHQTTVAADTVSAFVPAHGVAMFRVKPAAPQQAPPSTVLSIIGGQDLVAGQPGEITTTFTNRGAVAVQDVTLDLAAPDGWQVKPLSDRGEADIDPGHSASVTWQVTTPSGSDPGEPYELRAEADYRQGETGHQTVSREPAYVDPFGSYVPQSEMTAAASSRLKPANGPAKAIDGERQTMWHSAKAGSEPLPATLTLNLQESRDVNGFTYLPRQDYLDNGIVTGYRVLVSDDGADFTRVASGTWPDNAKLKAVTWPSATARHVRLEVTTGVNGAASAAEVHVAVASAGGESS